MSDITFRTLGVPHPLLEVLAAEDKHIPFPIQADTLPDTLAGKDVLGRGKTGSGKTLAFSIPMVARLGTRLSGGPRRAGRPAWCSRPPANSPRRSTPCSSRSPRPTA
jgi:superfamily II DNA/RNA helicase